MLGLSFVAGSVSTAVAEPPDQAEAKQARYDSWEQAHREWEAANERAEQAYARRNVADGELADAQRSVEAAQRNVKAAQQVAERFSRSENRDTYADALRQLQEARDALERAQERLADAQPAAAEARDAYERAETEAERTRDVVKERLEELQEAQDEAARADSRDDDASASGARAPAGECAVSPLGQAIEDLERGSAGTLAALDEVEAAIRAGDCDPGSLDEARERFYEAVGRLAEIEDKARIAATLEDPDPLLQDLGREARETIERAVAAWKLLEAHWAQLCSAQPACLDPYGGIAGIPPPAGGDPDPGSPPPPGGPPPPGSAGGGSVGAPPGKKPEDRVAQMPLVQDVGERLGTEDCAAASQQQRVLDGLGQQFLERYGNQIWFARLERNERAFLHLLLVTRLYDLAGQIALWNQLLPGSGEVPAGSVLEAAQQGTLPGFVQTHLDAAAEPGSLAAHGQPDTPEFRAARQPFDDALAEKVAQHREIVLAAAKAIGEHLDAARRLPRPARRGSPGIRVVDGPTAGVMPRPGSSRPRGANEITRAELAERQRAELAARERRQRAEEARDRSRREIDTHPVLRQQIDGRSMPAILGDPDLSAEEKRAAVDRAIAQHLEELASLFIELKSLDRAEAIAEKLLHPALGPLHQYVSAVMSRFCFKEGESVIARLLAIRASHGKDLQLEEEGVDLAFLAGATGIAVLTLVGVLLAPQIAIPILLTTLGGADAALSAAEYGVKAERATEAAVELERVRREALLGELTDTTAIEAAEAALDAAQRERMIAGVIAALSVVGGAADALEGTVQGVRIWAGTADAIEEAREAARLAEAAAQRSPQRIAELEALEGLDAAEKAAQDEIADLVARVGGASPRPVDAPPPSSVTPPSGPRAPPDGAAGDASRGDFTTEVVEPPRPPGAVADEAGGAARASDLPGPQPPSSAAGAADEFDPTGNLDDLRPPPPPLPPPLPPRAADAVDAAADADDEITQVVQRRPWGAQEGNNVCKALDTGDPDVLGKQIATGNLKGAQFPAFADGTGVVELGSPLTAGGFGTVFKGVILPDGAAASGLPRSSLGGLELGPNMARIAPMPPEGTTVAVKLFRKGEDGHEALKGELEGGHWLERVGIDFPDYYAVGQLEDGTWYAIKELVEADQLVRGPLDAAQQAADMETYGALARHGAVGMDLNKRNGSPRIIRETDGTVRYVPFQYEGDWVTDVANPSFRARGDDGIFHSPFDNRFDAPGMPERAMNNALPIQSLGSLDDVADWRTAMKHDPWVNAVIEAERRGKIKFDPTTKTFGSGDWNIEQVRANRELGTAVEYVEAVVQRRIDPTVPGAPTPASMMAGNAADEAAGAARVAETGGARAVGDAAPPPPALGAAAPGATADGPRVGGALDDPVRRGRDTIREQIERIILRLLPGPQCGGPYVFVANQAPRCWTRIDQVTVVPGSSGGGYLVSLETGAPEVLEQELAKNPCVDYVEKDKPLKPEVGASPVAAAPDDPLYRSRGSWGQSYDDQWALKRIGFDAAAGGGAAWRAAEEARTPVIVAVIDSGLDSFHPDLDPSNLWRNPLELPNGRDDDGNGYVDDLIGWNFVAGSNDPWDDLGHGTHVAGVIAAATGNGRGIAGIHPRVRIMPLKVLDARGDGRVSRLAEAIFYAVRNGARVINLSLGERSIAQTERLAIEHARRSGVLVVVAAGNAGVDTGDYGPAGLPGALTVTAVGPDERRPGFSNWGETVGLAAPGVDVLSLRAEGTDFNLAMGVEGYRAGASVVGADGHYYRASGTSFAAPFVSGVASLLFSRDPALTAQQVERMLAMSARDVEVAGWDRFTGSGRLDAVGALAADPDWELVARVTAVEAAREGEKVVIRVRGTAGGTRLASYRIELGQGETPASWKTIGQPSRAPLEDGVLGLISASEITAPGAWSVRLVATDAAGAEREARGALTIQ
ncbi:MAG TPA: S8 family serine peptidase [Thermoanaerobaculia bacterium]|nr:S8 family serine peptidase [Thermoanaerobaculia bacterium]